MKNKREAEEAAHGPKKARKTDKSPLGRWTSTMGLKKPKDAEKSEDAQLPWSEEVQHDSGSTHLQEK